MPSGFGQGIFLLPVGMRIIVDGTVPLRQWAEQLLSPDMRHSRCCYGGDNLSFTKAEVTLTSRKCDDERDAGESGGMDQAISIMEKMV